MPELLDTSLAEMRARAMRWIEPGGCAPVTRDTAINEEHLALDVVELCEEVERSRRLADLVRRYFDALDRRARNTDATWLQARQECNDLECELLRMVRHG